MHTQLAPPTAQHAVIQAAKRHHLVEMTCFRGPLVWNEATVLRPPNDLVAVVNVRRLHVNCIRAML